MFRPLRTVAGSLCLLTASVFAQDEPTKNPQGPQGGPPPMPPHMEQALDSLGLDEATYEELYALIENHHKKMHAMHQEMEQSVKEVLGEELFQKFMQSMRPQGGQGKGPQGGQGGPGMGPQGGQGGQGKGPQGGQGKGPQGGQGGQGMEEDPWSGQGGGEGGTQPRGGQGGQGKGPQGGQGGMGPQGGQGGPGGRGPQGNPEEMEARRMEMALQRLELADEEREAVEPILKSLASLRSKSRTERDALRQALDSGDDAAIEAAMEKLRAAEKTQQGEAEKLQAELKDLLTARQEAMLLEMNMIR